MEVEMVEGWERRREGGREREEESDNMVERWVRGGTREERGGRARENVREEGGREGGR